MLVTSLKFLSDLLMKYLRYNKECIRGKKSANSYQNNVVPYNNDDQNKYFNLLVKRNWVVHRNSVG